MSGELTNILERANNGYIGVNDELNVSVGYDQEATEWSASVPDWHDAPIITAQEKIELADVMIARWERYRERAKGK